MTVRVGIMCPYLGVGGSEQWALTLVRGTDPSLITWVGYGYIEPERVNPVMRAQMETMLPVSAGAEACRALAAACDIVLLWDMDDWRTYVPSGTRVVVIGHGHNPWHESVLARLTARDAIVAVSESAKLSFPARTRERVQVIWNGVDPQRVRTTITRAAVRAEWGVDANAHVLGFIGRLAVENHPDVVLDAAQWLPTEWEVVRVGPHLGIPPGRAPRSRDVGVMHDIGAAFAGFDVAVFLTSIDGFTLGVVEAWLAGVPVLATHKGVAKAHPNLVWSLPDAPSPQSVATTAQRALTDPTRPERVAKARACALERYSHHRFAAEWAARLHTLATDT